MNDQNTKKVIGLILITISAALYFLGYMMEISTAIRFVCFALGIWGLILFATGKLKS